MQIFKLLIKFVSVCIFSKYNNIYIIMSVINPYMEYKTVMNVEGLPQQKIGRCEKKDANDQGRMDQERYPSVNLLEYRPADEIEDPEQ